MSDSTCRKVAMKTMKRVMRWTANISVLAVFSSALAFSQGHSLRPDATADSAAGMFHTARSVGRRIYALHRNIAPGVARGRDSLAHRAADPNRVRSIALRASGIAMDAVELHAAPTDGSGSLFL
jgi:hypothetical protein